MKWKLIPIAALALVVGAALVVAFGALGTGDSAPAAGETEAGSRPAAEERPASQRHDDSPPPQGCTSLTLTPERRAQLQKVPVKGTTYFGACRGRFWWMARFPDGSDGVFKGKSGTPVMVGSIAAAKCKVPFGLLRIWRQHEDCVAASSDPTAGSDDPQSTVKQADPDRDKCEVPEVKVPNYDPTDNSPDQRLPRAEELLPPRSECPELYEGISSSQSPDGQRRYGNGRTWIEQYNWCRVMQQQGVPCTVPPPP